MHEPRTSTSYSALALHRRCPRAWAYRYEAGLSAPERMSPIRDLGSWWHALRAADSIQNRGAAQVEIKTTDDGPTIPEDASTPCDDLWSALSIWWKGQEPEYRDTFLSDIGATLPERLAAMDSGYLSQWGEQDQNLQHLAVETKVGRPLQGRDFRGYIDALLFDPDKHLVIIRDYKVHQAMPKDSAEVAMMDSQLHLYAWAASALIREHGIDAPLAVQYDRIRGQAPKEPSLTATGTLSKSVTDFDLHTYRRWAESGPQWGEPGTFYKTGAKAGKPKFGTYQIEESVVENLSTPAAVAVWYDRTTSLVSLPTVKAHLIAARDTLEDVDRTAQRWEATREAGRNLGRNCGWCEFSGLCRAEMTGGPMEYTPENVEPFGLHVGID